MLTGLLVPVVKAVVVAAAVVAAVLRAHVTNVGHQNLVAAAHHQEAANSAKHFLGKSAQKYNF